MAHPLTQYARAWLFGWSEVYEDPAEIRAVDLTPQMLRIARSLRRQMTANAHHLITQRLALDDQYMLIGDLQLNMRERSKDAFGDAVDQIRRVRRYDKKSFRKVPRMRARVREVRTQAAKPVVSDSLNEAFKADRLEQASSRIPLGHVKILQSFTPTKPRMNKGEARDELLDRLTRAKLIAGPRTVDDVDEMFARLYSEAPWMSGPLEHMWHAARDAVNDADIGFNLTPTLLVGPPGCGKTYIAQRIAELSNCPSTRLDMSGLSAAFSISGMEYGWSSSHPSDAVRLIDDSGAANPIMIADEVDKCGKTSGGSPAQAMLPLLQRSTAKGFREAFLQATIDLSRVSWILLANDLDAVPQPLVDRCAVFRVGYPTGTHLKNLVKRKLGTAEPEVIAIAFKEIAAGRISLRGLDRLGRNISRLASSPTLH